MKKRNISAEDKLQAVLEYLNGHGSQEDIAKRYGVARTPFRKWIAKYKVSGNSAFIRTARTTAYCAALKQDVIKDYLSGKGSYEEIAIKYQIPAPDTVRRWVLKYNGYEKLKASGIGGYLIMTQGRKTTFEERIEIVQYCISHDHNYVGTAEKYQVSYQQARNYTIKYESGGIEALIDKRGKRKKPEEMNELERLRFEIKVLRAEKEQAEMEASFLKKLEQIERGRG